MPVNKQVRDLERENKQLAAHVQVMRKFIQNMGKLGFYERNIDTGEITTNSFWQSCGYRAEELSGDRWLNLVHPDDLGRVLDIFSGNNELARNELSAEAEESGHDGFFELEYRVKTAWGQWRWVLNRGLIVGRDEHGVPCHYLGIDIDITDRKQAEEELRLQQEASEQRALEADTLRIVGAVIASNLDQAETLRRILEQAALVVPFENACIFKLNGTHLELIRSSGGRHNAEIPNKANREARIPRNGSSPHAQVLREEQPIIFNRVHELFPRRSILGRQIKSWMGVPLMLRGNLMGMLSFESTMPGFFQDSHLRLASAFADSVTIALENARLYEELRRLAITDELTAMYTRRWMLEYARRQLERTYRSGGNLCLLMIDVDFFKRVNDTFGHLKGDLVLRQIAATIMGCLRGGDVICRYGGEEFLALLPDTDSEGAFQVAERLRIAVQNEIFEGLPHAMTVSTGVCALDQRRDLILEELIHECDSALYEAKHRGRNCSVRFGTGDGAGRVQKRQTK